MNLFEQLERARLWLLALQRKLMPENQLTQFAKAVELHEGYYKGSRSYRNNNPGNLRYTAYTASLGAKAKDTGNFCIFASYSAGFEALRAFLKDACTNKLKAYKGTMSLYQFFEVYAPAADKNNPHRYADFVAQYLNIPTETQINTFI